jgi:type VI secretion system protein
MLVTCGGEVVVKTQRLAFDVDKQANLNHPIAMDLLIIYDDELLKQIVTLAARDWFAKRSQFKRDHPATLSVWEWEVVPGQALPFFQLPANREKAKGVVLFTNYQTEGTHRLRLDPFPWAVIRLQAQEVTVK